MSSDSLALVLTILTIGMLLLLVFRAVMLWYWKVNDIVKELREIKLSLQKLTK